MESKIYTTIKELEQKDGQKVEIMGKYQLYNPYPNKKAAGGNVLVRIVMEGEEKDGPFLGAFWHEQSKRSAEEMKKYEGKQVRVRGIYHQKQPPQPDAPDFAATFGGACIHPVDTVFVEGEDSGAVR